MAAWFQAARAKELTLDGDEENFTYQGDYIKELIAETDYPNFDIAGVNKQFLEWEHNKHNNIMTFRDCSHK